MKPKSPTASHALAQAQDRLRSATHDLEAVAKLLPLTEPRLAEQKAVAAVTRVKPIPLTSAEINLLHEAARRTETDQPLTGPELKVLAVSAANRIREARAILKFVAKRMPDSVRWESFLCGGLDMILQSPKPGFRTVRKLIAAISDLT